MFEFLKLNAMHHNIIVVQVLCRVYIIHHVAKQWNDTGVILWTNVMIFDHAHNAWNIKVTKENHAATCSK